VNDHMSPAARLAVDHSIVMIEAPTWTMEILAALVVALGIGFLVTLGNMLVAGAERDHAIKDAKFWRQAATADAQPTVKLSASPTGYDCRGFNIDPAWTRAVDAECAVLARLLKMARPGQ